jgi:hypothetical protein
MPDHEARIFIYRTHRSAEAAVSALQGSGYDLQKLSVIGRDCPNASAGMAGASLTEMRRSLTEWRSFWYRMWRILRGEAFVNIEGIGCILAAGPLANSMLSTQGGPGALNLLQAGLHALGVPLESMHSCEVALQAECYLVVAHGKAGEAVAAQEILGSTAELSR